MGEKYKNGIYSHNTASYFYGTTDRTPLQLDMTFPSNNRIKNDLLNVHYIKKDKDNFILKGGMLISAMIEKFKFGHIISKQLLLKNLNQL